VTTANIESTNGDSFFLKVGDSWNGLKVIAIKPDSVVFVNGLGQQTSLSFPGNDVGGPTVSTSGSTVASTSSTASVPSAPPLPNFSLRAMPVPSPPGGGDNAGNNTGDQGGNGGNQDNNGQ